MVWDSDLSGLVPRHLHWSPVPCWPRTSTKLNQGKCGPCPLSLAHPEGCGSFLTLSKSHSWLQQMPYFLLETTRVWMSAHWHLLKRQQHQGLLLPGRSPSLPCSLADIVQPIVHNGISLRSHAATTFLNLSTSHLLSSLPSSSTLLRLQN